MNNHQAENEAIGAVAVHATPIPAASQLITLDPIKYVAEVFKPFNEKFEILKAEADAITPDASTPAGMESAVKYRAAFRDDVRIAGEKARAARKAPILEIGKLLDSKYKDLVAIVEPYEAKFHDAIKAEEKRKEDAKKAEAARQDQIRQRLAAIRELPLQAIGKTSAEICSMLTALDADEPTEEFGALLDAAKAAHTDALAKLSNARAAAAATEAEAARIAAERAELQQLREAAAERARLAQAEADRIAAEQKAEADRLAAVAAEQEAASLREREAAAAKMKAEADAQAEKNRVAKAEIDRQMAELASAKAAAEAQTHAEQAATELPAKQVVDAIIPAPVDSQQQDLLVLGAGTVSIGTTPAVTGTSTVFCSASSTAPALTLGKIGTRLGFPLTADFLRKLGFDPAAKERSAVLYHESDWESICAALIRHITQAKVPQQQAA